MDTIRLSSKGHAVSFTTKSLFIDGVEYPYISITAIKHSSAKRLYLFKCDDQWHKLFYEPSDEKKVAALFKKITELKNRRAAKTSRPVASAVASPDQKSPVDTFDAAINVVLKEQTAELAELAESANLSNFDAKAEAKAKQVASEAAAFEAAVLGVYNFEPADKPETDDDSAESDAAKEVVSAGDAVDDIAFSDDSTNIVYGDESQTTDEISERTDMQSAADTTGDTSDVTNASGSANEISTDVMKPETDSETDDESSDDFLSYAPKNVTDGANDIQASETEASETELPEGEVIEDELPERGILEDKPPQEKGSDDSKGCAADEVADDDVEAESKSVDATSDEILSDEDSAVEKTDDNIAKKSRLKKSLAIFLVIIAVFVIAGIAYFFIFGTPDEATQNTNTDTTHQYKDIEELIDEMQE